jgi:hypothetical protein
MPELEYICHCREPGAVVYAEFFLFLHAVASLCVGIWAISTILCLRYYSTSVAVISCVFLVVAVVTSIIANWKYPICKQKIDKVCECGRHYSVFYGENSSERGALLPAPIVYDSL